MPMMHRMGCCSHQQPELWPSSAGHPCYARCDAHQHHIPLQFADDKIHQFDPCAALIDMVDHNQDLCNCEVSSDDGGYLNMYTTKQVSVRNFLQSSCAHLPLEMMVLTRLKKGNLFA